MARLTAPNGAVVSVGDDKVAGLVARGYTKEQAAPEKTKPKKSSKSGDK